MECGGSRILPRRRILFKILTRSEMPVTMCRLNLVKGLGPVMQICEGYTVNLPDEVSDKLWKRTDYTWPCTWFAPRLTGKGAFKSAYDVMNNWGANHGASCYGHIGADLITLCSILRIPVCMHNVPEEKYSVRWHGTLSEWIKRVRITEPARTSAPCINKV